MLNTCFVTYFQENIPALSFDYKVLFRNKFITASIHQTFTFYLCPEFSNITAALE